MLNKIANRAYKVPADRLNHVYTMWVPEAYKVLSQNGQLYIWLKTLFEPTLEQSSSQETIVRYGNQSIRDNYKMKSGRVYDE